MTAVHPRLVLFLFASTHEVIRAERELRAFRVSYRVIPVPRSISSQCGMALELRWEEIDRARELIGALGLTFHVHEGGNDEV